MNVLTFRFNYWHTNQKKTFLQLVFQYQFELMTLKESMKIDLQSQTVRIYHIYG